MYSYDWYDVAGGDDDSVASGIIPGIYHVEVTDINGCIDTGEVVINSPEALNLVSDSIVSTCSGICDGVAIINVTGGVGSYSYDWFENGNINNDSVYNLCADTFSVAVFDSLGCRDTAEVIITQPVTVFANIIDTTEVTCYLGSDGIAVIGGSGGTLPYTYWWNDSLNQTNDTAVGLFAGTYRAAVTDLNGCSDTTTVIIKSPLAWAHLKDSTKATCYAYCDAQITITGVGGTGPYTHSWSTGESGPSIINLCAGVYTDTITDSRGCRDTVDTFILEPDSLEARPILIQNVACNGDSTAMAKIEAIGGTNPYSFEWGSPVTSTQDTLYAAVADTYRVVVTDNLGCKDTNSISFTQPTALNPIISDTVHANCVCNAQAIVTPLGGEGPYKFAWNDGALTTDSIANGLCTGDYFVEVIDSNGCFDTAFLTIRDTSLFNISITDTTDISCYGICDGAAIVTPSLGTAPFNYLWSDTGETSDSSALNLCPGLVNVTVTDDEGCIRFASVVINQPDSIITSPMFSSPLCNGDLNGVAWVDVSGGTGPYFHSWDTTSINDTVYNIGIGFYTDTITDSKGCLDTVIVNVIEPDVLLSNLDSANISCFNSADGSIWSSVTGGTAPYEYQWNDFSNSISDTVNNLDVGTYTAIVTDIHGCSDTDSISITQPLLLASLITDTNHVACYCSGTATVTPIGGTPPFAYLWSDPNEQTDSIAINLCAGSYSVAVIDANGCSDTAYVSIRDTSGFITNIVDSTMNDCFGSCNGSALARAENGVQPYDFLWNDLGATNDSIVNDLCAGEYAVTISDAIGCTHIENVIITAPDSLELLLIDTMVSCNGGFDGKVEVIMTGGTEPYSYQWDNVSSSTTAYVDSLSARQYIVEVLDDNDCFQTDTIIITQPAKLIAFINPYSHVSCFGENDATLTAMPTGGTGPFTYFWNSGESTQTILGKGPNTYSVIVTDSLNCFDDTSLVVIEPIKLTSSITDTTHVLCGGAATGSATVTPEGGTYPYSYDWFDAPGNQTDSIVMNLTVGTYKVQVMDANGCSDTSEVVLTEPTMFSISITETTASSCSDCDGTATVTATGGVGLYIYNWFDAPIIQTDSIATGLCSESYNVEVSDGNGCKDTLNAIVPDPVQVSATVSGTTETACTVCDGTATIIPTSGIAPFTFNWYDAVGVPNVNIGSGLCASNYNVEVIDDNGCADTVQLVITGPDGLTATISDTTMVTCNGLSDGRAVVAGIGGTAPYSFLWDDVLLTTSDTLLNLKAGTYSVAVTDVNACYAAAVVTILEPNPLSADIIDTISTGCLSPCTGNATVEATGGTGPFTYEWDDWSSQTNQTALNLCAAQYSVNVTDVNGCKDTATALISGPSELTVAIDSVSDITCNGICDGSAAISISGGVGGYSYLWNDPANTTDTVLTDLCEGDFIAQVTDGNGCLAFANISIVEPEELIVSIGDSSSIVCNGSDEGWALVNYTGGTAPFTIVWNDASLQSTDTAFNLVAGTYDVTVTDVNGCNGSTSVTFEQPEPIIAVSSNLQHVLCTGFCIGQATITASGGTTGGGYGYLWEDGQTTSAATGLCQGFQTYTITDGIGCTLIDSVEILDQNNFIVDITGNGASCNGVCDGAILATVSGGIAPYLHSWNNGFKSADLSELCSGTYIDTIQDNNGCFLIDSFVVGEPELLNVEIIDSNNLNCFGICNGKAVVTANGGTGIYSYTWYNSPGTQINDTAYNLCADTYFVKGEDANGCTAEDTILLTQPSQIIVSLDASTDVNCAGQCNGSATISALGGTGVLNYVWDNGDTQTSQTDLCAKDYTVYATDDSLCIDSLVFTISQNDSLIAIITDTTHIVCASVCNGDATVGETGGIGPYTYDWYDAGGVTTSKISAQCIGQYNVEVTDGLGCKDTASVFINDNDVLDASILTSQMSCKDVCDGKLVAQPLGGVEPYTFLWSNGVTLDSIEDLCQNNFFVTVTDFNGCQVSVAENIIEPAPIAPLIIDSANLDCFGICDGFATVSPFGGTSPYTYQWNDDVNQTGITATGLCAQKYKVFITDAGGCIDSTTVNLEEPTQITSSIVGSPTACTNVADGSADITTAGGVGSYVYSWTNQSGYISSDEDPVGMGIGNFNVTVIDGNGCSLMDSVTIAEINIINANAGNDTTICETDSILLTGSGGLLYSWSNGVTTANTMVAPITTQEYILNVFNNGCSASDTVVINVNVLPEITATTNNNLILEGTSAQLNATGAGTGGFYDWSPPLGLDDPTIPNPNASVVLGTTFFVTGTDINGCSDTSSLKIEVSSSIKFSDGITPNGDGLNEIWTIQLIEEFPGAVVKIYNRWGQEVFESVGYSERWDGTKKGKKLPVGTYYYFIDLGTDQKKYSGPITIMR